MRRTFGLIALLGAGLALGACATVGGIATAPPSGGVERIFYARLDSVVTAARQSLVESGLALQTAEELVDGGWKFVGERGSSAFSYGELVRVVVQPVAPRVVSVRVLTQRRLATNITARGDYSQLIFGGIAYRLRD